MDADLVELHEKVDRLSGQLAYLAGQAEIAEQQRADRAELMRDLTPIADQAYHMAVEQLEEVQEYIDLGDLLRLLKRLLRNGRNLDRLLSQLESLVDLAETAGPLADEAFGRAVQLLTDLEHKGYFAAARGGARILDNIVTSFSEDDVRRLGDNVVLILNTVKEMTQPEIMHFVHDTLLVAEAEVQKPVDASLTGLLRQLRDPAVRRGLALTMRVLHVVGAQAGSKGAEAPTPQPAALRRAARRRPCAPSPTAPGSRPRKCSRCSPRGRPRRSPTSPGWASPRAAFETRPAIRRIEHESQRTWKRTRAQGRLHLLEGQPRHGLPGAGDGLGGAGQRHRGHDLLHLLGPRPDQQETASTDWRSRRWPTPA